MRISVIGCGYLGAVHAACIASLGHDVVGIETDPHKIRSLQNAKAPFFEPSLPELLAKTSTSGRLTFSSNIASATGARVHFLCVGTPQAADSYAADLNYVDAAFGSLLEHLSSGDIIVGKSTVPVGTAERLASALKEAQPNASLVWNPEFLREGFAVEDTLNPDRIVYGIDKDDSTSVEILNTIYAKPIAEGTPVLVTDFATAQLVKVAANSFLATKISFINAMAELCELAGGDVTQLADAIGHDVRIGRRFLNAGLGFGGGCLPKDIRAFMARAEELGADEPLEFLRAVDAINVRRRKHVADLALKCVGGDVSGMRVAVLGAAFKPNSDDVRDSPALDVAAQISGFGADVVVTDPQANDNARRLQPHLHYVESVEEAVTNADLVLLLTEWKQFTDLDPMSVAELVRSPRMIDGRNALDPQKWRDAGWTYIGLGRP